MPHPATPKRALLTTMILATALVAPTAALRPASADTAFPQTGFSMSGPFEEYWNAHGGLAQFGMPRTAVYPAGADYDAQWFERALFTYNPSKPDPYKVELNLLGNDITATRRSEEPFKAAKALGAGQFFAPTGHNLSGKFLDYWQRTGGLPIYGYPISEAFNEKSKSDGKTYLVQYFERNRFELHPELAGTPFEVQLGLLGSELLDMRGGPQAFAGLGSPRYYPGRGVINVPPGTIVQIGTPVPGSTPQVPPAPALPATTRPVLFADDFSSGALQGWTPSTTYGPAGDGGPAPWRVQAGYVEQTPDSVATGAAEEAFLLSPGTGAADVTLEAYFRGSGETIGAVLRFGDAGYYQLLLYPRSANAGPKATLLLVTPSSVKELASSSSWSGFAPATWQRLAFTAKGSQLTVTVDGAPVLQATDATLASGRYGLYAYADGRAKFDNVRATAP